MRALEKISYCGYQWADCGNQAAHCQRVADNRSEIPGPAGLFASAKAARNQREDHTDNHCHHGNGQFLIHDRLAYASVAAHADEKQYNSSHQKKIGAENSFPIRRVVHIFMVY